LCSFSTSECVSSHLPAIPTRRSSDLAHSPRRSAEIDRIAEAVASQDLDRHALRRDRIIAVIPARGEGENESEYRDTMQHRHTSRSEEHTSELQSRENIVCRLLLEKKK